MMTLHNPLLPLLLLIQLHFIFSFHSVLSHLLPIFHDQESNTTQRIHTYIVHVQKPKDADLLNEELEKWHKSFLPNTTLDSGEPRLVYSYHDTISGFAARLTKEEVKAMESMEGFIQAQPDEVLPLLTTYTPDFVGLSQRNGTWYDDGYGKGMVIGILDTGIDPTHPSFSDEGMPMPPVKWKGTCDSRVANCNNKIIGAAEFLRGKPVPTDIDDNGHGTHVASIAAGNFVDNVDVLGNAKGTADGMAPRAHLAIYKVCTKDGCADSDILAGIDQAISDRVDVLSVSIGIGSRPFYQDSIAIGSFAALRRKILTCAAAGNAGPSENSIANDAPWILTVGATTTDRRIKATLKLGNETELIEGETAYQGPITANLTMLPMAFPGYQGGNNNCLNETFNGINVTGMLVLCLSGGDLSHIEKGMNVKKAGGAAMVVLNQEEEGLTTLSEAHVLPAIHVNYSNALKIISFFNSSLAKNSTAMGSIFYNGTQFGALSAPAVASFSSRGPSYNNGGILKPDILGPGVNILGAWPSKVGPESLGSSMTFNFQSGTSMAAAHVAGIAALIKNSIRRHRRYPSSIKSAIITSAKSLDREWKPITDEHNGNPSKISAMGAGQVNPSGASDPGLVYHLHTHYYVRYLCSLGYTDEQIRVITQYRVQCLRMRDFGPERLNYPSILVTLGIPSRKVIRRVVENVGEPKSIYYPQFELPEGVSVEVYPSRLEFSSQYEKQWYNVVLSISNSTILGRGDFAEGQLLWVSPRHVVRSPITIIFN